MSLSVAVDALVVSHALFGRYAEKGADGSALRTNKDVEEARQLRSRALPFQRLYEAGRGFWVQSQGFGCCVRGACPLDAECHVTCALRVTRELYEEAKAEAAKETPEQRRAYVDEFLQR
jgi:hypothetical protein